MCECIDLVQAETFLAENPTREVIQICLLKDEAIVIRKTSRTMQARETLLAFLYEVNPPVVYIEDTVEEVVEANFDTFDEKTTRLLIESALKERDANLKKGGKEDELLGSWGVIIDLVKATTMRRCVIQAPPFGLLYCYTVPAVPAPGCGVSLAVTDSIPDDCKPLVTVGCSAPATPDLPVPVADFVADDSCFGSCRSSTCSPALCSGSSSSGSAFSSIHSAIPFSRRYS
jgi:hypothetical protein